MPETFTCITCQVIFKTPELQREHYKLDWHRYNLKRKVVNIPPVSLEEFDTRAREHKEQSNIDNQSESEYCKYCSKLFSTKNSFNNHLNSKKHKLAQERYVEEEHSSHSDADSYVRVEAGQIKPETAGPAKFVVVNPNDSGDEDIETDSDIEEVRL
jgi:pre-60S factor REI1